MIEPYDNCSDIEFKEECDLTNCCPELEAPLIKFENHFMANDFNDVKSCCKKNINK